MKHGQGERAERERASAKEKGQSKRETVRASRDGGRRWPVQLELAEGPSGYSSLALIQGDRIGCLYETGKEAFYERIEFVSMPLEAFAEVLA